VHPDLVAALVADRRKSCPCDGATAHPNHPCGECLARLACRLHAGRPPQNAVRRTADRQSRARAWTLAAAASMLRISSEGTRS
jgi:hypothetical protein